jgi:hypothetical protein
MNLYFKIYVLTIIHILLIAVSNIEAQTYTTRFSKSALPYFKQVVGSQLFYYPVVVTNGIDTSTVVVLDQHLSYCFPWKSGKFKKNILTSIINNQPLVIKNQTHYNDLMLCKAFINDCYDSLATYHPDFFKQFEFNQNPNQIVKSNCISTNHDASNSYNGFILIMIRLGFYCKEAHGHVDFYADIP